VRLLQIPERERLPNLRENKLIHLKKEINAIIEELLKENEIDIRPKDFIYAAATVIIETISKPGKAMKNK
jgi:predicted nucleic-acid-binding protein